MSTRFPALAFTLALAAVLGAACSSADPAAPAVPPELVDDGVHDAPFAGGNVRYLDRGPRDDSALVLVHGWGGDHTVWRFQVPELERHVRVLAVDLPGHGASSPSGDGYSMDLFARSLAAVLDDAGVSRAVLAGHSNGTPVVRQFYRLHPERTAGLVVVDGALRAFFTPEAVERFVAPLEGPDWRAYAEQFVVPMLLATMEPGLRDELKQIVLSTRQDVLAESLRCSADPALWVEDPIDVPLLVLLAASAPFWDAEYEAFVRRLAPHVDYRKLDGVGHFLMLDDPPATNAALLAFLSQQQLLAVR